MNTFIDIIKSQLIGKKLRHTNRYNRVVVLEVEDIRTESGSREIGESNQSNDWWPDTEYWTHNYILFKDGSQIKFDNNTKFDIVD